MRCAAHVVTTCAAHLDSGDGGAHRVGVRNPDPVLQRHHVERGSRGRNAAVVGDRRRAVARRIGRERDEERLVLKRPRVFRPLCRVAVYGPPIVVHPHLVSILGCRDVVPAELEGLGVQPRWQSESATPEAWLRMLWVTVAHPRARLRRPRGSRPAARRGAVRHRTSHTRKQSRPASTMLHRPSSERCRTGGAAGPSPMDRYTAGVGG